MRFGVFADRDIALSPQGCRVVRLVPAKRVAWAGNEAYLTVRRDIAHRTKCGHGNAVEVAERPAWAGLSEIKKTPKIAAYFAPQ